MPAGLFYPSSPLSLGFNTLSAVGDCGDMKNISQAINSHDYANEDSTMFLSSNTLS